MITTPEILYKVKKTLLGPRRNTDGKEFLVLILRNKILVVFGLELFPVQTTGHANCALLYLYNIVL